MESNGSLTASAARDALAQVQAGRGAAARRVTTPWWYHPLLGVALAAMLGSLSLRGAAGAAVFVLALVAQVGLYVLYRRLTGLWVNTWHVPEMRGVTAAATAVCMLLLLLGLGFERSGLRGSAAAAGVILGVAYAIYWRWVERRLSALWSASR